MEVEGFLFEGELFCLFVVLRVTISDGHLYIGLESHHEEMDFQAVVRNISSEKGLVALCNVLRDTKSISSSLSEVL